MSSFNQPVTEVSWDQGKTWQEYVNCCRPGMLMRIVAPDGKILWRGRGITVKKPCGSCNGTGICDYFEFKQVAPGDE